jgi:hypothetical protein
VTAGAATRTSARRWAIHPSPFMKFELPPEKSVRDAYGISADDPVEISQSDSLPSASWLKKAGAYLTEAASHFVSGGVKVARSWRFESPA